MIVAVSFAIQLGGLAFLGWLAWTAQREFAARIAESQRLTRAVAALVVRESDKIRTLLADPQG